LTKAFGASPLLPDARHGIFLAVITLLAIFAAGGHSRHRALNKPIRLFGAVAGACLINWAPIISRGGVSSVTLTIVSTAGLPWFCILVVRELSEWFLNHVWPDNGARRGRSWLAFLKNRRISSAPAAGGDYRVVDKWSR
jgi:hypothetical protein